MGRGHTNSPALALLIVIISLQANQLQCQFPTLPSFPALPALPTLPAGNPLNNFWNYWRKTTTTSTQPPRTKAPISSSTSGGAAGVADLEFNGTQYDRTESSLYPTTPSTQKEFQVWEVLQEQPPVKGILQSLLSTPSNHTPTENESNVKKIISDFLISISQIDYGMGWEFVNGGGGDDDSVRVRGDANATADANATTDATTLSPNPRSSRQHTPHSNLTSLMEATMSGPLPPKNSEANSPLMAFFNTIRQGGQALMSPLTTSMSNSSELMPRIEAQVKILRDNLVKMNLTGTLEEGLKVMASRPVTINSLISGVTAFVRCNTIGLLNGMCDKFYASL